MAANLPLGFLSVLVGGILLKRGAEIVQPAFQGGGPGSSSAGGGTPTGSTDARHFFPGASFGRIDMGIDLSMSPGAPIHAPAPSKLIGTISNWYAGQPFVWYQIVGGPDNGKYYYVAEQFAPKTTTPGATFNTGDVIGTFASSGTGIEAGWAAADGRTQAQATTGYSEGQATAAGQSFAHWLGL